VSRKGPDVVKLLTVSFPIRCVMVNAVLLEVSSAAKGRFGFDDQLAGISQKPLAAEVQVTIAACSGDASTAQSK